MDKDTECSTVQKENAPDICSLMSYRTHYIHITCVCTVYCYLFHYKMRKVNFNNICRVPIYEWPKQFYIKEYIISRILGGALKTIRKI